LVVMRVEGNEAGKRQRQSRYLVAEKTRVYEEKQNRDQKGPTGRGAGEGATRRSRA